MYSRGLAPGAVSTAAPAAPLATANAIARVRVSKVLPWLDYLRIALSDALIVGLSMQVSTTWNFSAMHVITHAVEGGACATEMRVNPA